MKKSVETFVAECPVCQRSKFENCPYPSLLTPLPIPEIAWSFISMDFNEGLPKFEGKDTILVVVDRLTKFAHFLALAHPFTAQSIAQLFIDQIIKLHGIPVAIVTDGDMIFTSKLWQDIFKSLKISLQYSTAYHPQADGQTERVNQCLKNYLRCMTFLEPKKWISWLPLAEYWYNINYHTSLKSTPFEALYGYAPPLISEIMVPSPESQAMDFIARKQQMITRLKENLAQAQARTKKYADMNRTERSFSVGDMVYLKLQPFRHTAFGLHQNLKLSSKFYGPFRILAKVGQAAYKLHLPSTADIHPIFHVSQLKKHLGPRAVPKDNLPMVTPDGHIKVQSVSVLDTRAMQRRDEVVTQWLIQRQNLSADQATWEDKLFIKATFPDFYNATVKE
jgi:hypothetical protein